jgi:diguanylate cyclase (GGDEF)-like protein
MRRPTFGVTSRFAVVLLVVVPSLLLLAWEGSAGLTATRGLTDTLFNDIITTQHASADMVAAMDDVHVAALSSFAARQSDPERATTLAQLVSDDLIPKADAALAEVQRLHGDDEADELATIADLAARWIDVRSLWNEMVREPVAPDVASARIDQAYNDLNRIARALVARETRDGQAEYEDSHGPYEHKQDVLRIALVAALVASLAAVAWLHRGILPRARRFAAFADRIADGEFDGHLEAPGADDLAVLGRTLDEMATRRHHERTYDTSQLEFAESMQLTEDEAEAHRMLRRHLERSIDGSAVVILNRNNSQDRLEAVTEVAPDSPLVASLDGAVPRSCVAVRQARTHERAEGVDALLQCPICSDCPGSATCTPFLVGGEVIGSVLLTSPRSLRDEESRRVRDSVVQAAPVLANLRTLAIAETRAATDSLTGLPNRRAADANLLRMVAQAGRSAEPLALLLFDLDHFKQVNDRFGHAGGDEVLAAVGAALTATVRESDFAGRFGGEEFIVALPGTGLEGALEVAEVLRQAVRTIVVPSVDQPITMSVGVAVLPDHAGDATRLVRSADRALYLAKQNGRDRIEVAWADDREAARDRRAAAAPPVA